MSSSLKQYVEVLDQSVLLVEAAGNAINFGRVKVVFEKFVVEEFFISFNYVSKDAVAVDLAAGGEEDKLEVLFQSPQDLLQSGAQANKDLFYYYSILYNYTNLFIFSEDIDLIIVVV